MLFVAARMRSARLFTPTLALDAGPVRLDGPRRQEKERGDLDVRVPEHQEVEHLALSIAERRDRSAWVGEVDALAASIAPRAGWT